MNKNILLTSLALFFVACSTKDIEPSDNQLVPVTIRLSGFSFTQEELPATRAAEDVADYSDVKAIDLKFFAGATEVFSHTQLKSDESTYTTFGEFSANLSIGSYTMVAVARNISTGDVFTITSPTQAAYTTERARETFCATQSVTVTSTTPLDLDVALSRIMSMFRIVSTDAPSAGVSKIRTTYAAGSKAFNPTTGLATDDDGFAVTNSKNVKDGVLNVYSNLFLSTDEQTMNVTIEVLDESDNVLFTKLLENVSFKRNRVTKATGAMFGTDPSESTFKLETEWLDPIEVTF